MAIHINPKNKGKLRSALHAKKGQKLSVAALKKAKNSSNPILAKRANFALNAKHWKH